MESLSWQTRYVLLLWLSIVVKIPFDLSRFDASSSATTTSTMDRILAVGRAFLPSHDVGREASAFMLSQFLTRPDVKAVRLDAFVTWALDQLPTAPASTEDPGFQQSASELAALHGTLQSLALIFKHGGRDDTAAFAPRALRKLLDGKMEAHPVPTVRRLAVKIVNRLGLVFLPVRIASWRYTRGARSLEENLATAKTDQRSKGASDADHRRREEEEEEEDVAEIAEEVEEIIEFLLTALKDRETIVRWSAAKGVGRVTSRLPRDLADQVVGSVLESFSAFEGDGAWHGGCLTLAELGRRGLLLPERLPEVVPVVVRALVYEDRRGNYALGAHVRDAACYVCWSFARAYDPGAVRPHVRTIAGALLVTAVFDREVNCRRAASAAFQENVGRQASE